MGPWLGAPGGGGHTQPSPRCHGSESHPAMCPARSGRAREAARAGQIQAFPRTGGSSRLSCAHIPSPQRVLTQGRDEARSAPPTAGIVLQSCLGAASLTESTGGSQEIPTPAAYPESRGCGAGARTLVPQPLRHGPAPPGSAG